MACSSSIFMSSMQEINCYRGFYSKGVGGESAYPLGQHYVQLIIFNFKVKFENHIYYFIVVGRISCDFSYHTKKITR